MAELILMRHAKSDWTDAETDFERGLNKRGQTSCKIMAERLAHHGIKPDLVLSSTARRCQMTATYLIEETGLSDWEPQLRYLDSLYLADPQSMAQIIEREVQAEAARGLPINTLCIIGHNPGLSDLIWDLVGERAAMAHDIPLHIPTTSFVWMTLPDLTRLAPAKAELVSMESPRQFYDFDAE